MNIFPPLSFPQRLRTQCFRPESVYFRESCRAERRSSCLWPRLSQPLGADSSGDLKWVFTVGSDLIPAVLRMKRMS